MDMRMGNQRMLEPRRGRWFPGRGPSILWLLTSMFIALCSANHRWCLPNLGRNAYVGEIDVPSSLIVTA